MLRCNEVTRRIASGDVDRFGWFGRAQLWLHLRMCEHCRRYASQVRAIGRAARDALGSGAEDSESLQRLERVAVERMRRKVDPDSQPPAAS